VLWKLREMGIGVALDDFGTGFSSLSYVARLPATTLKIDKSFVDEMASNSGRLAIVSTVISLAHALGMTVVAEGVEMEEQRKLLAELGCDEMQGFLHSRPMPIGRSRRCSSFPDACFKLAEMNGSRSPSSTPWVLPTLVLRSLMRDW
jgi:EAL domain-containing protein (putative c-di-GMP-specific phosphodiesterase class I)